MDKYDGSRTQKDFLMEVTVRYRSEKVAHATVRAIDGCYVYHNTMNAHNHTELMTQIALPNSNSVDYKTPPKSPKLLEFTDRILHNLKYGIVFTYDESDNCVYATRLCNSMVFVYSTQFQTGPDYPVKLKREHRVKVYDCNAHRMSACTLSDENKTTEDPCVFFSVAQKWQPIVANEDRFSANFSPDNLPLEDCLISVALKLHISHNSTEVATKQGITESAAVGPSVDVACNQPIRRPPASSDRLCEFMNQLCARVPSMEGKLRLFEERLMQFEASSSELRNEFHELVREATGISIT